MSDLSAFLLKKKAAAKKKKNKVDIEGLHRKLEKSVQQQREEEDDWQEREEEMKRDENFLKEKREVDDEWIDHTAENEFEVIKVRDMAEESEEEIERQPSPATVQADGTIDGVDDNRSNAPKTQTFSWGAKPEPVVEVEEDEEPKVAAAPVKENPNAESVGKFIPSAVRRQMQMGGLTSGMGYAPKVDDQELFPSLGAAADIEAKQKEEQRIEQERRDKKLAADALREKKRDAEQAKRDAEYAAKEGDRKAKLEKDMAEVRKQRADDIAKLEKQRLDRANNPPAVATPTIAPVVKPVEEASSWRDQARPAAPMQQPVRPMPTPMAARAADAGPWARGGQQQARPQQPPHAAAPADAGKWERGGQQATRAPPMNNAPAATDGAWRRGETKPMGGPAPATNNRWGGGEQQTTAPASGGAWQSKSAQQRAPLNDRKF